MVSLLAMISPAQQPSHFLHSARSHALLAVALHLAACAGAPSGAAVSSPPPAPPPSAPSPAPSPSPTPAAAEARLRARGDVLFLTAPPNRYKRGELLYVLDLHPLHNDTRLRIGLVQVVSPSDNTVTWYCRPRSPVGDTLAGQGLPVADFAPDTRLRAGKCWGGYDAPASTAQAGTVVDLPLNLGPGDGVHPDDLYEVLGEAVVDRDGRAVLGFEPLGRCTVLPFEGTTLTSLCRIDRAIWPKLDAKAMARPGFVRLLKEAPPATP